MAKGGLGKWFAENWVDVKTGKPCGRKKAKGSKRPYPACRPKSVAGRISKREAAKKTGEESILVHNSIRKEKKKEMKLDDIVPLALLLMFAAQIVVLINLII